MGIGWDHDNYQAVGMNVWFADVPRAVHLIDWGHLSHMLDKLSTLFIYDQALFVWVTKGIQNGGLISFLLTNEALV